MSFEALAQHLASRNSLRIYNIQVDDVNSNEFHITPEEFDGVDHAAGSTLLCRMGTTISGAGNTVTIAATIESGEILPDIPIELNNRDARVGTVQAFQLVEDNGALEFHLINLLNIFDIEDDLQDLKELGFLLVEEGGTPVLVEYTYKVIAKGGLEVQFDKNTKLSNSVYISPTTKVYIETDNAGVLDAGLFLTEATVATLIETLATEKINELVIRDERTPSEYEFENNISLPNGTIYFQLNAVVDD